MATNERYYVLLEKMAAWEQYDDDPLTEAEMAELRALIKARTCPECHAVGCHKMDCSRGRPSNDPVPPLQGL